MTIFLYYIIFLYYKTEELVAFEHTKVIYYIISGIILQRSYTNRYVTYCGTHILLINLMQSDVPVCGQGYFGHFKTK